MSFQVEEYGEDRQKLSAKTLRQMIVMDQKDVVLNVLKHYEQFQNTLEDATITDAYVEVILEILAKVYKTRMREDLMKILALFPNSLFLQKRLPRYIMQLALTGHNTKIQNKIKNIIMFFDEFLERFPDLNEDVPLDSLSHATSNLYLQPAIKKQIEELSRVKQAIHEGKQPKRTRNIEEDKNTAQPPNDYRQLSVYPTNEDFAVNKEVFLRENIVKGKYHNVDHYLDIQFRLLREDFLGPLREGIGEILQDLDRTRRFQNLRIYRDIAIIDTVCTEVGISYIIHFDAHGLRKVNWERSKRLIYGSLLGFSKDNFDTISFAVITERDPDQLKDGYLQVRFLGSIPKLKIEDRVQMVESPSYYESYVHNLERLQELNSHNLSFSDYLVQCETVVTAPRYLTDDVAYNLSNALGVTKHGIAEAVPVLDTTSWPSIDDIQLNGSQLNAVKSALTKEFVVIQGPPGTGKTYLGLRIVQALLDNMQNWCTNNNTSLGTSQILVVCYTNHALDQFLEGILKFHADGIVRVGARSSSADLMGHNLSNKTSYTEALNQLKEKLQKINEKIIVTKKSLLQSYNVVLGLDALSKVMEKHALDQLSPYECIANYTGTTVIEQWLMMEPLHAYAPASKIHGTRNAWGTRNRFQIYEDEHQDDATGSDEDKSSDEEEVVNNGENVENVEILQVKDDHPADNKLITEKTRQNMTLHYIDMLQQKIHENDNDELEFRDQIILEPNQNIWSLDHGTRQQLYDEWVIRYREMNAQILTEFTNEYEEVCKEFKKTKQDEEERVLRNATVVGMTTTGAAKYRNILQKVQPRIVVVEEAAEVLEAHLVTALSKRTEHLILIGDHKQLRPNSNVYKLAKDFNLEISLFERMVKNGMECHVLDTQHRMRPEISQLMHYIYDDLNDDESVTCFPDVKGISNNIFFIDHQHSEKEVEDIQSHRNQHEAEYIVALCRYLLLQGYTKSQITILTTYVGQLLEVKKIMSKTNYIEEVRLCTVDNYQGEENDIILLSLVRSNKEGKIGFLGSPNRICVALSRARIGFYCIGNVSMLARNSDLWARIESGLEKKGFIGKSLQIYCSNHVETKTLVSGANDFEKAPRGGCLLPCDIRLDCGHKCEYVCHPDDNDHLKYICDKKCDNKVCSSGHICGKRCHDGTLCDPCETVVIRSLSRCGHSHPIPCSIDEATFECKKPCKRFLPCGHRCQNICSRDCSVNECKEIIEIDMECGHKQTAICSVPPSSVVCKHPCGISLECGHRCEGTCGLCTKGRVHVPCNKNCARLLVCSHLCQELCSSPCRSCQLGCKNACMHRKCGNNCADRCLPCQEQCAWVCKHSRCNKKCFEICDRKPCNVQCRAKLRCSVAKRPHYCMGLCGEKCPNLCKICNKQDLEKILSCTSDNDKEHKARFIELLDCGHIFEVKTLDKWMSYPDQHVVAIKFKVCPDCDTPIRKSARYGNVIKQITRDIEIVKNKIEFQDGDEEARRARLWGKFEYFVTTYPLAQSEIITIQNEAVGHESGNLSFSSSPYLMLVFKISSAKKEDIDHMINQIELLSCLYEVKTMFWDYLSSTRFTGNNVKDALVCLEKKIFEWRLTKQTFEEIREEIVRVSLQCRLGKIDGEIARSSTIRAVPSKLQTYLQEYRNLLKSEEKVGKVMAEKITKVLNRICGILRLDNFTLEEEAEFVNTVASLQNHWFRCIEGHVFKIEVDVGNDVEQITCPYCEND